MFYRNIDMSQLRRRVEDISQVLIDAGQELPDDGEGPGWVYEIEDGLGTLYYIRDEDGQPTLNWGERGTWREPLEQLEQRLANLVREQIIETCGEDEQAMILKEPAFYVVCVALRDKAYGGPEEGGWWYDTTEPQLGGDFPIPVVVKTRDEAEAAADIMSDWCLPQNEGRPSTSSVLSEGVYVSMIYEGEWPRDLPETVPHYE
jgi:hypothetical protein